MATNKEIARKSPRVASTLNTAGHCFPVVLMLKELCTKHWLNSDKLPRFISNNLVQGILPNLKGKPSYLSMKLRFDILKVTALCHNKLKNKNEQNLSFIHHYNEILANCIGKLIGLQGFEMY